MFRLISACPSKPSQLALIASTAFTSYLLFQIQAASAADTVVSGGTTTRITLPNDGDTVTVENGASINTTATLGTTAVSSNGDNQEILNNGTIAGHNDGINVQGVGSTITNNGALSGVIGRGIDLGASSGGTTIYNNGSISADQVAGISFSQSSDGFSTLLNYGQITSMTNVAIDVVGINSHNQSVINHSGGRIWSDSNQAVSFNQSNGAFGTLVNHAGGLIWSTSAAAVNFRSNQGYQNSLVNHGTIWSTASTTVRFGMDNSYGNTLVNYGTIRSTAGEAVAFGNSVFQSASITEAALLANNPGVTTFTPAKNALFNYGLIESTVDDAVSLRSVGRTEELTNEGTIRAASGFDAISISSIAGGSIVNLKQGSILEGGATFGSPNDTLNIENLPNLHLDYDGTLENLTSDFPVIHDVANTVVHTIDPTGFGLSDLFLSSTSSAIHDATHEATRDEANRASSRALGDGFAGSSNSGDAKRVWATGFGGAQNRNGSGYFSSSQSVYGGFAAGFGVAEGDKRYGVFGGAAQSNLSTDNSLQQISATSAYAGIFGAKTFAERWLSASAMIGHASFDSERRVISNTAIGGIQTVTADYHGYVISASADIAQNINDRAEIKVGGDYSALLLDEYQEDGGSAGLNVSSRNVHRGKLDAQLTYLAYERATNTGLLSFETWAGVEGEFNFSDDVSIDGLSASFCASPSDTEISGFVGLGIRHVPNANGWFAKSSLVANLSTKGSSQVDAQLSLSKKF